MVVASPWEVASAAAEGCCAVAEATAEGCALAASLRVTTWVSLGLVSTENDVINPPMEQPVSVAAMAANETARRKGNVILNRICVDTPDASKPDKSKQMLLRR